MDGIIVIYSFEVFTMLDGIIVIYLYLYVYLWLYVFEFIGWKYFVIWDGRTFLVFIVVSALFSSVYYSFCFCCNAWFWLLLTAHRPKSVATMVDPRRVVATPSLFVVPTALAVFPRWVCYSLPRFCLTFLFRTRPSSDSWSVTWSKPLLSVTWRMRASMKVGLRLYIYIYTGWSF